MLSASVIISYYKNLSALELILMSLNRQKTKALFEVIVSEDDNDASTVEFIDNIRPSLSYPLIHVSQEDRGFNKCVALNKSVLASKSEFLIFIDGDCIPHVNFLESYIKHRKPNAVLYGRRVMLSEHLTKKILSDKTSKPLHLFNLIRYGCKRIEDGIFAPFLNHLARKKTSGILLGCNMGIHKTHLFAINGFDEDYTFPGGGEDSDIEWRFKKMGGVNFISVRYLSIVYHLWHVQRFDKEREIRSTSFMRDKIQKGDFFCKNGLQKYL